MRCTQYRVNSLLVSHWMKNGLGVSWVKCLESKLIILTGDIFKKSALEPLFVDFVSIQALNTFQLDHH